MLRVSSSGAGSPAHEPAARQVLDLDRRPVLLGDHEAGGELARTGGGDLVGRVAAEQPRGGRVGVDRLALVVVDGDGLGERAEDAVEPRAGGAQVGDQPGVGEHERDAAGEDLEEREIVGVVRGLGRGEPERAEVVQRDQHPRPAIAAARARRRFRAVALRRRARTARVAVADRPSARRRRPGRAPPRAGAPRPRCSRLRTGGRRPRAPPSGRARPPRDRAPRPRTSPAGSRRPRSSAAADGRRMPGVVVPPAACERERRTPPPLTPRPRANCRRRPARTAAARTRW